MFLFPKKIKFNTGFSSLKLFVKNSKKSKNVKHVFGSTTLIAKESGLITNFQQEALRRFLKRFLKKKHAIMFRFFPLIPVTKKPNDVRQGRGKGKVAYWAHMIKKGDVILEIRGSDSSFSRSILSKSRVKLSIKTYVNSIKQRWIL